jgi:hypothetical protein
METRSKNLEIADEAQEQMDPLQNALKEHLLQELMFQHFTGNEAKQLFEVSTLWNEIASESKKCGEKLKLTINTDDKAEKLTEIEASGRKYATVKLKSKKHQEPVEIHPLLIDIIAGIGWNLKKLDISYNIKIEAFVLLLSSLHNLETLSLRKVELITEANGSISLQLPKLKELKLMNLQSHILGLFRNVTALESFKFISYEGENIDMKLLEDFITRQDKLKTLSVFIHSEENQQKLFADKNRLKEMKFQLETICLASFTIHPSSAEEFFRRQQSLKEVHLGHYDNLVETPEEFCQVMRPIFELPNLKTLKILVDNFIMDENWIGLQGIRNTAVKFLELAAAEEETSIDGAFVEMFPNLQEIKVTLEKRWNPECSEKDLFLINFPCEKLSLVQCENVGGFVYQTPLIEFDQTFFETKLEEFLLNNSSVNKLHIGRIEWIALDIKLSLQFWEKILQKLPNLNHLVIFHPGNIIELVNLLKKTLRNFEKVTIKTNNIGRKSAKNIQLPSWIHIFIR